MPEKYSVYLILWTIRSAITSSTAKTASVPSWQKVDTGITQIPCCINLKNWRKKIGSSFITSRVTANKSSPKSWNSRSKVQKETTRSILTLKKAPQLMMCCRVTTSVGWLTIIFRKRKLEMMVWLMLWSLSRPFVELSGNISKLTSKVRSLTHWKLWVGALTSYI